jgi:Fe-S cluster assembly scaffold protein SufB
MNNRSSSRVASSVLQERDPAWAREFEGILKAYEQAGGRPDILRMPRVGSVVINSNHVLAINSIDGVDIETEEQENGVLARVTVAPGTKADHPIHLCFGMTAEDGLQEITSEFDIGEGADVGFLAHCTFPNAVDLKHVMDARIRVGPGATMRYNESHYHGPYGGIAVLPTTHAQVDEGGFLEIAFSLVHGRIGQLGVQFEADVGAEGAVELSTKAYGSADDEIKVTEVIRLNGQGARGLTKTRAAVRDRATSEVYTTTEGNAPGAVGHMDCTEIVRGDGSARNVPEVVVRDDQARVTHEASIGNVSKKELETLMARGLDEDEAVDIIVRGMLG